MPHTGSRKDPQDALDNDRNRVTFEDIAAITDVEEAQRLATYFRDEIIKIDAQLSERKNQFLSGPWKPKAETAGYYAWRDSAVRAKAILTRLYTTSRAKLSELNTEVRVSGQESGTRFWRARAGALRRAIDAALAEYNGEARARMLRQAIDEHELAIEQRHDV